MEFSHCMPHKVGETNESPHPSCYKLYSLVRYVGHYLTQQLKSWEQREKNASIQRRSDSFNRKVGEFHLIKMAAVKLQFIWPPCMTVTTMVTVLPNMVLYWCSFLSHDNSSPETTTSSIFLHLWIHSCISFTFQINGWWKGEMCTWRTVIIQTTNHTYTHIAI